MAIFNNTPGVESISFSSNSHNKVIIVHNKLPIAISIGPIACSAVDLLACWINLEALCFPEFEISTFLQEHYKQQH
jgi:hypothetical protein